MLWGTSSLALYIPWAGNSGPYLGISLWLWLGVLDAIQGVGLGMILLQVRSLLRHLAGISNDLSPLDVVAFARLRHTSLFSSYWLDCSHDRPWNGAESNWTRQRFP